MSEAKTMNLNILELFLCTRYLIEFQKSGRRVEQVRSVL